MSLHEEIFEQPDTIARTIAANAGPAREVARLYHGCTHVVVAARGTSDNAGRYAQYVWGSRNGISVGLTTPSLFSVYDRPPRLDSALVVGISQSGESPDIVAVLDEARKQGRPTVAITNEPGSPLAGRADVVLDLDVGEERAVAATKTYTSQLAVVALISAALDGTDGGLGRVSGWVAEALAQEEPARRRAEELAPIEHCAVLGRGFNNATAFEWALKLQELSQVVAQPFSTADFVHGPVAVLEPGYPVLAVVADGPAADDVRQVLERCTRAGASLTVVGNDPLAAAMAESALHLNREIEEWLSPIPAIVVGQLFAYHLTLAQGLDPDSPRGLRKVTRTV